MKELVFGQLAVAVESKEHSFPSGTKIKFIGMSDELDGVFYKFKGVSDGFEYIQELRASEFIVLPFFGKDESKQ